MDSSRIRVTSRIGRRSRRGWGSGGRSSAALQPLLSESVLLKELEPVSKDLADVAAIGLFALRALVEGVPNNPEPQIALLEGAAKPKAEVSLAVMPAVRRLVEATARPVAEVGRAQ